MGKRNSHRRVGRLSPLPVLAALSAVVGLSAWSASGRQTATTEPGRTSSGVELAVRVLKNGAFVDGLKLADFEVTENSVPASPAGLALVEGQKTLREEGVLPERPATHRNFYLLFQATEWDPKLAEAIDYLVKTHLSPGDAMTLVTPMKAYSMSPEALSMKKREDVSKNMQNIVRRDIQNGSGDYRSTVQDLRRIVKAIGGDTTRAGEVELETDSAGSMFGLEMQIDRYKQSLLKLEALRLIDEKKLLEFASGLKAVEGRKFVFFFYQREFRPEISPSLLNTMMSMYQEQPNILNDLQDLFNLYKRAPSFDMERLAQAFADSAVQFNFIFMNKESMYLFGAVMREQSEDIFPLFSGIAKATGGTAESAQNPAAAFRAAADESRKYYLLYYDPPAAEAPGFRKVDVRVKAEGCEVLTRAGYIAR